MGAVEAPTGLIQRLECLLFVAGEPLPVRQLAAAAGAGEAEVREALETLCARLETESGLQLVELAGGFQLSTKPEHSDMLAAFLNPRKRRMSRAILETLAVIAYRQPVTLAEVESVRGVNSEYSVHALVEMSLVEEVGRKDAPGRPKLFGTTRDFLHEFKLSDLDDLPPLETAEAES